MASYEEKKALRDKGMTYQQIANALGCSRQAVAQSLSKYNPNKFQFVTEKGCKYPNIRKWMNEKRLVIVNF